MLFCEGGEGTLGKIYVVGAIPSDVLQKDYLMLYGGDFASYSYRCASIGTY
jgi:hypothetical protein